MPVRAVLVKGLDHEQGFACDAITSRFYLSLRGLGSGVCLKVGETTVVSSTAALFPNTKGAGFVRLDFVAISASCDRRRQPTRHGGHQCA